MAPDKQTPNKGAQTTHKRASQNASHTPGQDSVSQLGPSLSVLAQRAQLAPHTLTPHDVLHLQRTIGNRTVTELLAPKAPVIQPKLTVGPADDPYEQEADRVAEQVMAAPVAQRALEDEEELQAKPISASITPL